MDAAHEWTDKQFDKLESRLVKEYAQAAKELEQTQARFMKAYSAERAERLKALDDTKEAKEAFDNWCHGQAVVMARNQTMIDSFASVCTSANIASAGIVSSSMPGVFAENYNFAARDINAKTGVSFALVNEKAVKRLVEKQPKLLPDPKVDIPKDMRWNRQKMTSAITQGILQGESNPQIAKRLQSVVSMNQRSAVSAARTAVTGAENGGRLEMFKDAEDMGLNIVKVWMATADGRTRESHLWINGEEKSLDKEFSNGCMFPGDPNGEPGEVINCRCSMGNQIDRSGKRKGGDFIRKAGIYARSFAEQAVAKLKDNGGYINVVIPTILDRREHAIVNQRLNEMYHARLSGKEIARVPIGDYDYTVVIRDFDNYEIIGREIIE